MMANNIFRILGDLFQFLFSISFDLLRLNDLNWWVSNAVNWMFMGIFLCLLYYWMKESLRFKKEGIEDKS